MSSSRLTRTCSGMRRTLHQRSSTGINYRSGFDQTGRPDGGADRSDGEDESADRCQGDARDIEIEHIRSPLNLGVDLVPASKRR